MIADANVAWLAGLLEGEGSFTLSHPNSPDRRPQLRVALKMKDKDVVERAAALFPSGSAVIAAPDSRENKSDCWAKSWNGADAAFVMDCILPYMGQRRSAKIRELLKLTNLSHHQRVRT